MLFAITLLVAQVSPEYGLRLGLGHVFGRIDGAAQKGIDDLMTVEGDAMVEAGVRAGDWSFLGGAQYGTAFGVQGCGAGHDCSLTHIRLGLQLLRHDKRDQTHEVWFGVGAGWDIINLHEETSGGLFHADGSAYGPEFLNLQAGYDWHVGEEGRIGIFALSAFGMYLSSNFWLQGYGVSGDVQQQTVHFTMLIGVRAYISRAP